MSLLDDAPQSLQVYPEVVETDAYGNPMRVPGPTPVVVPGRVQPSTADENSLLGQTAFAVVRFIGRTFPGGPWAKVVYDGREWDVVGEPRRHNGIPPGHVTVYLKARTVLVPEV